MTVTQVLLWKDTLQFRHLAEATHTKSEETFKSLLTSESLNVFCQDLQSREIVVRATCIMYDVM